MQHSGIITSPANLVVGQQYKISDNFGRTWLQKIYTYNGIKGVEGTLFYEFDGEGFDAPLVASGQILFRVATPGEIMCH